MDFVDPLRWPTIEVFIVFLYRLSYCYILGIATISVYIVYFVAFLVQNHLPVSSHATVCLDSYERGNLFNDTVNYLEFAQCHSRRS